MSLIVTGCAGFIGFHLAKQLLERGDEVIGVDNINSYYDVRLKQARLQVLKSYPQFKFHRADIADMTAMTAIFKHYKAQLVVHLAAQAGVRYSLSNPEAYVQSNLVGFANVIDAARCYGAEHFIYASTSAVYGASSELPSSENQDTSRPLSFYAATKKSNEVMAYAYSHLYQLPTTGLRFFTVYGPWGRPDMAFFSFTEKILAGKAIEVYNQGNMVRDFTYIDDIITGILLVIDCGGAPIQEPFKIYNIGYGAPVKLLDYITAIEQALDKKAIKLFLPRQAGDVLATHADTSCLREDFDYQATVDYQEGIERFVAWYKSYYKH